MIRRSSIPWRLFAPVLAVAALAAPGRAQTPPPAPDFYATAVMAGFERPLEVRQSGMKRRVEVASDAVVQTFISDRARGALIVMTAAGRRRLAFVFPLPPGDGGAPLPLDLSTFQGAARLDRVGGSTVAGRPCALYRYSGYLGHNGVLCATAEGVVVQMTPDGRRAPIFQVTSLTYARQDPRWFLPPPDYQLSALPGAGGILQRTPAPTAGPAVPGISPGR